MGVSLAELSARSRPGSSTRRPRGLGPRRARAATMPPKPSRGTSTCFRSTPRALALVQALWVVPTAVQGRDTPAALEPELAAGSLRMLRKV